MLVRSMLLGFLAIIAGSAQAQQQSSGPSMKCETGPVNRTFGGTNWLVYSCTDHASMVVVSAPNNPALPYYFFLKPSGQTYAISGEGTGSKQASDAAGNALSKMTPTEFSTLLAATTSQIHTP